MNRHYGAASHWCSYQALRLTPPLQLLSHLIMLRGWHREQGFCTRWDMALSCGNISGQLYPHASPPSGRLISPSSSFHSLVNDITHLSPGLSRVNGTAGIVPGAQFLGNINQSSPCCHWLRQREAKGKPSSCPLLYFLGSHSYKLLAEWEVWMSHTLTLVGLFYMNSTY